LTVGVLYSSVPQPTQDKVDKMWYYTIMTKKMRRVLFYCALVLFLAVSYVVLLYAQGYQYSFSDGRFVRTGAISLKVNTEASILLDGEVVKGTSFLGNNASIDALLPGSYIVAVEKDGYSKWQKKVVVEEGFVQDFSNVLILPQAGADQDNVRSEIQNLLYPPIPTPTPAGSPGTTPKVTSRPTPPPKPTASPTPDQTAPYFLDGDALYVQGGLGPERIASNVKKVVRSNDGQKIAWISNNQLWVYWLSNSGYQPYRVAGDIMLLARFPNPIKTLVWFRDSDHLALDASLAGQGGLKVVEIDTRGGINIINF